MNGGCDGGRVGEGRIRTRDRTNKVEPKAKKQPKKTNNRRPIAQSFTDSSPPSTVLRGVCIPRRHARRIRLPTIPQTLASVSPCRRPVLSGSIVRHPGWQKGKRQWRSRDEGAVRGVRDEAANPPVSTVPAVMGPAGGSSGASPTRFRRRLLRAHDEQTLHNCHVAGRASLTRHNLDFHSPWIKTTSHGLEEQRHRVRTFA